MNSIFRYLAIGVPVSCAAISILWAVKKYRKSETEEYPIQEKEELKSHLSARSEPKPAIKAETSKEKEIPIKLAPDEVEKEPFCHSSMKSTVESSDEELKIKEVEEKPQKTNEMEEMHISLSGIITQALKKREDDIKRRPDLCGTTESSQIGKDEEEIQENVSENSNTFAPSTPSKEKVKPLWTPKRKNKSKKKRWL